MYGRRSPRQPSNVPLTYTSVVSTMRVCRMKSSVTVMTIVGTEVTKLAAVRHYIGPIFIKI